MQNDRRRNSDKVLVEEFLASLQRRRDQDRQRVPIPVSKVFDDVLKKHWHQKRFTESGHAKEATRLYFKHIEKVFGETDVRDINPSAIRRWHAEFHRTPTTGNRALSVLGQLFSFAIEQEVLDKSPCAIIKRFPQKKRKRVASLEELKKIIRILETLAHKDNFRKVRSRGQAKAAIFILAVLYTGARPRSLLKATWSDLLIRSDGVGVLSFHGKTSSDSGEDEVLIFPTKIMKYVVDGPRYLNQKIFNCPYPRDAWAMVRRHAGCKDLWLRDMRRTFASIGLSSGISIDLIGETLNHKNHETTKTYAKALSTARIQTVNRIEQSLNAISSPGPAHPL